MPRHTGPDPLKVIAATLGRNPYDNHDDKARKVIADLAGHGLIITHQPAAGTVPRCGRIPDGHPGTALVNGHCPICGWTPT
jgi:hypothetical protein